MSAVPLPNYGIDADRVLAVDGVGAAVRRRLAGRYTVDEFGGDPHLQDLLAWIPTLALRVRVVHSERVPASGPALVVANRGLAPVAPLVLAVAIRRAAGRRLRVVGAPEVPVVGPLARALGAIGHRPGDVAALLRAGHLAAAPLGPSWLRDGAGEPPRDLVAAALGVPVIPMAVRADGPLHLPVRGWRIVVGEALLPPPGTPPHDLLAAAELSERVRHAVEVLLEDEA